MKHLGRVFLATTFFLLTLSLVAAKADDDPPGRVARLQYMSGSVSVQPHGNEDWVQGTLNSPLTNADNIWTDKESKAELNVGGGTLRMNSESSLTLTNVDNGTVQLELHQGTLNLHVSKLFGSEIYEVDTPNVAFTVQKAGDYRFDVDPDGDTTVITVRKGEGDATGNGPGVRIKSDEQVSFSNGTSLEHTVAEAPAFDGFDSWCGTRDKREDQSVSARYVSPGVIGYEDLDDNGVWSEVPPYGPVWTPTNVAAGWAPYRYGHWAWVSPWGWTWVDDASWGFAPFHYGRWVYYGNSWGWAPGPIYATPVYAPALVAWFGGGGWGVSVGFGFGGGFGWCPLGWREPFYPWYHSGYGYFRNVNISNTYITNINHYYGHPPNRFDHYANYRAPGAFTAVPSRTLQSGLPVQRTAVHLNPNQIRNVPVARTVGLTPNRGAVLGANAGRASAVPPSRSFARPVVSRNSVPGRMNTPAMAQNNGMRSNSNPSFRTNNGELQGMNRGVQGPNRSNNPAASSMAHNVPRPPNASVSSRGGPANLRGSNDNASRFGGGPANGSSRNYVPRPPNASVSQNAGMRTSSESASRFGGNTNSGFSRTAPHPASNMRSPAENSNASRSTGAFNRGAGDNVRAVNVPRPTGPVRPASQVAGESRTSGRSYGNPSFSRGNYSDGGYAGGRVNSMPSYGGSSNRGYSPSISNPSRYTGGAPSYRSYGTAPSYGSRGGSPTYGGGSPSYRASAPSSHGGGGFSGGGAARGGFSGSGGHAGGGGGRSGGGHGGGHR